MPRDSRDLPASTSQDGLPRARSAPRPGRTGPPAGSHPARHLPGGRHELGQNLLIDRRVVATVERLVADLAGPVVEFGPGDGALTVPVSGSGRPVTAVELDPRRVRALRARLRGRGVTVVHDDFLHYPLPEHPHVLLGNIPFHLTTALLRRIFPLGGWTAAVLLVQWEVARRRAGVGGATLLTASWWPWYEFSVHGRVPARAFRPVPGVDGGLLRIERRPVPLIGDRPAPPPAPGPAAGPGRSHGTRPPVAAGRGVRARPATAGSLEGLRYQRFVSRVFTAPGRGLGQILPRATGMPRAQALRYLAGQRLPGSCLPRDLDAAQWAALWDLVRSRPRR